MTENEPADECSALLIAQSGMGHVAACAGCGNVHLTMEYLTVRLRPAAFRELAAMLAQAQHRIETILSAHVDPTAPAPADETVH
jgi:hypothetical protein